MIKPKTTFMRKFLIVATTFFFAFCASAQLQVQYDSSSNYYNRMNYIFANVNRSAAGTGLLLDFGIEFTSVADFNGNSLTDSNYVDLNEWLSIYSSIVSAKFGTAGSLTSMDSVHARISSSFVNGVIPLTIAHYNYNTLRPDAISANLMYSANDQLYDVQGRQQSPYNTNTVFAACPAANYVKSLSVTLQFKSNLYLSNTSKTISALSVDYGSGYVTMPLNAPFTFSFSSAGQKEV